MKEEKAESERQRQYHAESNVAVADALTQGFHRDAGGQSEGERSSSDDADQAGTGCACKTNVGQRRGRRRRLLRAEQEITDKTRHKHNNASSSGINS